MASSSQKPNPGPSHHEMPNFGFGLRALRKRPELVPLVLIVTVAACGMTGFAIYSLTKPDVKTSRKQRGLPELDLSRIEEASKTTTQ